VTTAIEEAKQLEEAFLSGLNNAQDAYERIVETEAWTTLGFDAFADWWVERVMPIMRALSMKPTRELGAAVVDQVRTEEAGLPPAQRRTQRELAEMAGVHPDTLSGRKRQDPQAAEVPPTPDLDVPAMPAGQDVADAIADAFDRRAAGPREQREPVMLTLRTHTGEEVPYRQPSAKATFNETTGDGISWAAWSWNPVTGCLHGCDYCYARAIAARFPDGFPVGFTPLFHDERLDAPSNTTVPAARRGDPAYKRVFVCSMADLYGRWVPDEWIARVHDSMLAAPWWEYLLLTKFPARYVGLDLPPNAWVGTSVDEQKRVRIAEDAFRKIDGVKVKWLSLEPLREPLEFTDLSMFDWVVIGAQTETRQPDGTVEAFAPPWKWVLRITEQAWAAGCDVHWKPNLVNGKPGFPVNEYPGGQR
jgi:protein gp37